MISNRGYQPYIPCARQNQDPLKKLMRSYESQFYVEIIDSLSELEWINAIALSMNDERKANHTTIDHPH